MEYEVWAKSQSTQYKRTFDFEVFENIYIAVILI